MTTQDIIQTEDTYQIPTYAKLPIALVKGEGLYVWDSEGRKYLDFYGGHCVTPLGHCPPGVVAAVCEQADELLFYSNVVYSPVRARAAQVVAEMAPEHLKHVFFCNSGTEANETALKLARTFTKKPHVVAMDAGFHGRTLGSLAATHGEGYRAPYLGVLADVTFVPFGDAGAVEQVLRERDDVGGLILEPIQSMAGVTTAPEAYFQRLRALCDQHGVALIFDEVQTGVGRTGRFSISEHLGVTPDLVTMAKSLGSGLPVGAVLAHDRIAEGVRAGDQGTTFGGGMLPMAALTATLETIRNENLMAAAENVFARVRDVVRGRAEVRGRGCLIGLDLGVPAAPVVRAMRERGVLTGGAADPHVIRLMPPYTTDEDAIGFFADAFHAALDEAAVKA